MRDRTARTGWARGTAAQDTGNLAPRRSFAGARRTWPSGARFDSILAWDGLRGMRNPPGPRARGGEACRGLATARLGCGRRWNVGVRCPGLGARIQAIGSSATGRGGRRDTHRALNWGGVRRSGVDGRWSGGGAPGKILCAQGSKPAAAGLETFLTVRRGHGVDLRKWSGGRGACPRRCGGALSRGSWRRRR